MVKNTLLSLRRTVLLTWRRARRAKIVNHAGVKLAITDVITPTVKRYIYAGDYEKSELKGIRRALAPDDIVLELGAGLGFISTYVAQRIGGDRVFAYEANPALEPTIRRNYELNRVTPTLELCMLGAETGVHTFYIEQDFWTSSTIASDHARAITVPVKPVNEVIQHIKPTMLIMDVEGGEIDLIPIMNLNTVRKIAVELHPETVGEQAAADLCAYLKQSGFQIAFSADGGKNLLLLRDNS